MTEFDQLTVVQEACNRVTNAFNPGNKITKGMIKVLVMDDSLLCDMGMTKQMITSGIGNYYAYITIFNGNTLIKYLIAANSPKKAVINAMNYMFNNNATDAVIRERIDKFRIHVNNYLSQQAIVIKQEGILPRYHIVFQCDLKFID